MTFYREAIDQRLGANEVQRGMGAWGVLIELQYYGVEWADSLATKHWPLLPASGHKIFECVLRPDRLSDWVANKMVEILPGVSPFTTSLFQEDYEFHALSVQNDKWPDWLTSALLLLTNNLVFPQQLTRVTVPGVLEEVPPVHFLTIRDYMPTDYSEDVRVRHRTMIQSLVHMPTSTHWLPWLSISRFLANPTKETLATECEAVWQHVDEPVIMEISTKLPWPMTAILARSSTGSRIDDLPARIRNGDFGDTSDWLQAEQRLAADGIVEKDINYTPLRDQAFDSNIGRIGFPSVMIPRHFPRSTGTAALPGLFKAMDNCSSRSGRHLLLSMIFACFSGRDAISLQQYVETPSLAADYATAAQLVLEEGGRPRWVPHGFLVALAAPDHSGSTPDWYLSFLDWLGQHQHYVARLHGKPVPVDFVTMIAAAYVCNPSRVGLLAILLHLTRLDKIPVVIPTALLDLSRFSAPHIRLAAVVIQAHSPTLTSEQIPNLASQALSLDTESSDFASISLLGAMGRFQSGDLLARCAATILELVSPGRLHLRRECVDILESYLRTGNRRFAGSSAALSLKLPFALDGQIYLGSLS